MFYKYRNQEKLLTSDVLSSNIQKFAEGFTRPEGPFKEMSEEDKEKVHLIIDLKLSELEQLDMTREEILQMKSSLDGQEAYKKSLINSERDSSSSVSKGLKLKDDPFFQYIKNERLSREILLSPNETFTVEKIINLALRQDIGPDMAASRPNKVILKSDEVDDEKRLELEEISSKKEEEMKPSLYFSGENPVDPWDFRDDKNKDIPEPRKRGEHRRRFYRNVNL